tara:strand:+ start:147 stop:326 length:180 start_codon:yes stop_codon:yes gene_type:complete
MVYKVKETAVTQIAILFSQFLFFTVLVSGFSLISITSYTAYERSLSPLYAEGAVSSLYD